MSQSFEPGKISAEDVPALVRRLNVLFVRLTAVLEQTGAQQDQLNQLIGSALLVGDGASGDDGTPGPPGATGPAGSGATGAQGPLGPAVFLLAQDGEEGERGLPGFQGQTGAQGPTGPALFFLAEDGEPGEPGVGVVGPRGPASTGDIVFVPTTANTNVASNTDVTIITRDVTGVAAGTQLIAEAHFTILQTSGATRTYVVTLDFDGLFDVEFTTQPLATSATLAHPFYVRGILDARSTILSYGVFTVEGQIATGLASGIDTTTAATHQRGMGWGTSTSDVTGTTTVALLIRSDSAATPQTLRLHHFSIRQLTPT